MNTLPPTDEERIDALDHLVFRELGHQAQWRDTFARWEQRQQRARRRRLIPVFSNIASVAALFLLGLIFQAMVPNLSIWNNLQDAPLQDTPPAEPASVLVPDTLAADTLPEP